MKINIYCISQKRFLSDYELLNTVILGPLKECSKTGSKPFQIELVSGHILVGKYTNTEEIIWEVTDDLEICVDSHGTLDICTGCTERMTEAWRG